MKTSYELFGVECGPGWRKLIEPLIKECNDQGVFISQIKEKYGTLRFYTGPCSQELQDKINKAEELSSETCEECGNPGKIRGRSWLYTACDKHIREIE